MDSAKRVPWAFTDNWSTGYSTLLFLFFFLGGWRHERQNDMCHILLLLLLVLFVEVPNRSAYTKRLQGGLNTPSQIKFWVEDA